ncbi:hypothetical protein [Aquimarina latercula]|uniref:hypothetical protein n=1 Tax=Aquimarina latercula TaxID=987 RepID=UPI000402CC35|nr:hypothetical protein [Aquimarina latercula]
MNEDIGLIEVVIAIVLTTITSIWGLFRKKKKREIIEEKKKNAEVIDLTKYPSFIYNLDNIEIENFHYAEEHEILVPTYDGYGGTAVDYKMGTTFKTTFFISFDHEKHTYTAEIDLPLEHTSLRMRIYKKKETKIYVLPDVLLLDLRFFGFNNLEFLPFERIEN